MFSLEHKFLKWDWANRYFPPDKLFLKPRGTWEGEGRTWPLLRGKSCATRFSPWGRDAAEPRTLPFLRLLFVPCGWRCLAGLQAPRGLRASEEKQKGRRTAAGRRDRPSLCCRGRRGCGGFPWALWGDTSHSLGALRWTRCISAAQGSLTPTEGCLAGGPFSYFTLKARCDWLQLFIESVSLREKEVGGQGSAPSQIVLLLEKALFAFGWSSLPSLHCSPKSPLPPTCPPRNPCLGAERWGLKDAAGHRDPSTCSQGFSGSRWSGIRHLRQETNHLTLGWLIILPSLFSIFSQQSLFAPTKNYFKKSHREV